nr:hypothetical protein [Rhizobium sp. NZLR8]
MRRAADLFGATVNIAARIAALASPGQLLATQLIAEAAGTRGIRVRDLERWRLDRWRGSPSLYNRACSVGRPGLDQSGVQDPCSIFILYKGRPAGSLVCSPRCKEAYRRSQQTYELPLAAAARSGNSSDLWAGVVDKTPAIRWGLYL